MNPLFSIASLALTFGCSHGVFGNTCDADIECMDWLKMPGCYWEHNAPIHTPEYLEAIHLGRNVRGKIKIGEYESVRRYLRLPR